MTLPILKVLTHQNERCSFSLHSPASFYLNGNLDTLYVHVFLGFLYHIAQLQLNKCIFLNILKSFQFGNKYIMSKSVYLLKTRCEERLQLKKHSRVIGVKSELLWCFIAIINTKKCMKASEHIKYIKENKEATTNG